MTPSSGLPDTDAAGLDPVTADVLEQWRALGGRRTPGKVVLLRVLAEHAPRHLTVAEIHELVAEAGWPAHQSGLGRALNEFASAGLVHLLPKAGPVAYGLAYPPHHHAICRDCGRVIEIPEQSLTEAAATATEEAGGFRLSPGGLALLGQCQECGG